MRQILRDLAPYVRGSRRQAGAILITSLFAGAAEAVALLLTVRLALAVGSDDVSDVLLPVVDIELSARGTVGIAIVCAVAALVANVWIAHLSARLMSRVLASTRSIAVNRYVEAGWPTQEAQREGALQETTTSLGNQVARLANSVALGSSQLVTLVTLLVVAFIADAVTTLVVVLAGAVIVSLLRPLSRISHHRASEFVNASVGFAEGVAKMTSTAMELRVFGVQQAARSNMEQLNADVRNKHFRARFVTAVAGGILRDIAVLLLALCIGVLVFSGSESIAGLGVAMALVIRALASAQAVNAAWHNVIESAPGLSTLNRRLEELDRGRAVCGSEHVERLNVIDLCDVSYTYDDSVDALRNVDLQIPFGESLGVMGPSGSGKSTLVQVLLRLRPPTSGEVLVNDRDYLEITETSWSSLLAFVPQEPTLIEGSVAQNILYYRPEAGLDVFQAARDANVYDDIMRLPAGFDTVLGPRGTGLSGGQKQRVAIARALVNNPQFLVLDEPSSALDAHSEQLLHQTLERLRGRTTMVIVAHRIKTVEACDRILVLDRGRISQLGTPDELMSVDGFYRSVRSESTQ